MVAGQRSNNSTNLWRAVYKKTARLKNKYIMENFRGIKAKYIGPTNNRGAYIKLVDLRRRESIKLSLFNTDKDDASEIAEEYLKSIGIEVIGRIENGGDGYILFTDNFTQSINSRLKRE